MLSSIKANPGEFSVSFAAHTLFAMERNGCGNQEVYENILLPVLREKYMHLDTRGLTASIWALSR